jgi:hypothetical protein
MELSLAGNTVALAVARGFGYVRLPLLGAVAVVICRAARQGRPWFMRHRSRATAWRTVWIGRLQISHHPARAGAALSPSRAMLR